MNRKDIVNQWISSFAPEVSDEILNEHVFNGGNFLWHVFTWGEIPCLCGDDARKAFDELEYDSATVFYSGYSKNDYPVIKNIAVSQKISSEELETMSDVYFVCQDFKWTYVHTHESSCGPYFRRVI